MKKLFNVRDFMFNAADVQKLGQYVADQIGLYDGLTLMNQDEIKDLTEEEPDDKRYSEALKNMDKYDMAVYCVDGSIKTGSEEDLAPIIVDGIEGRLRARDVWNLIDRLGLHPEDTGEPELSIGDVIEEGSAIASEMEDSTGYKKEGYTLVATSQDSESHGQYSPLGTFDRLDAAQAHAEWVKKSDESDDTIAEGTSIHYIVHDDKVVDVIVY